MLSGWQLFGIRPLHCRFWPMRRRRNNLDHRVTISFGPDSSEKGLFIFYPLRLSATN